MSNEMYYKVREFHKAFGQEVADKPTPIDKETALKRAVWAGEELIEFLHASVRGDEKEFYHIVNSFLIQMFEARDEQVLKEIEYKTDDDVLTAQVDALTDELYFNQGSFTLAGVEPYNLFKIVQDANMGKLWEDGKPRFRESDGKIVKPPNWERDFAPEPRLKEEIEQQKGKES